MTFKPFARSTEEVPQIARGATMANHFGVFDGAKCPQCGNPLMIVRRSPNPQLGTKSEQQTLICPVCKHELDRSVDGDGQAEPQDSRTGEGRRVATFLRVPPNSNPSLKLYWSACWARR
jgi:uncharacterized protein YbaR (Trm112 family)